LKETINIDNPIITILITAFINLFMTIFAAYPLSRKDWVGRKFFTYMLAFTMFFAGKNALI